MELSSSEMKTIQHQYDALAKKTLKGEMKSHYRDLAKRAAREIFFSEMSEIDLAQLFTMDEYESEFFRFQVSGFDIFIRDELLAAALNALTDRSTVSKHKKIALARIKQYMEGKADEKHR